MTSKHVSWRDTHSFFYSNLFHLSIWFDTEKRKNPIIYYMNVWDWNGEPVLILFSMCTVFYALSNSYRLHIEKSTDKMEFTVITTKSTNIQHAHQICRRDRLLPSHTVYILTRLCTTMLKMDISMLWLWSVVEFSIKKVIVMLFF